MDFSNKYVLGFALVICLACSALVSATAVALKERQDVNRLLDQQRQVIRVAGLVGADEELPQERVDEIFQEIRGRVIDRETGEYLEMSVEDVDPLKEAKDPATSTATPSEFKAAQVSRLPQHLEVFEIDVPGKECIVLPIHGKGLWSTMYGYLALKNDLSEVVGITFYQHGETPGLGGEVDNPAWKAQWPGKAVFDGDSIGLGVVKASAPRDEKYQVDGLSGATITTNGVDATIELWLGPSGYGPYLQQLKTRG
ncbi:MAG: Na(+)-translocating NADH-quinone reductase subunit C [Planctomycetota bacterium]